MKVICIDDSGRPNEIRTSNWLVRGNEYTVKKLLKSLITNQQYYSLEEVTPDPPYGGYRIERFAIPEDEIEKFFAMFEIPQTTQEELLELLTEKGILEEELV